MTRITGQKITHLITNINFFEMALRQLALLIMCTVFLFSCSSEEYLYDKVGFDPGSTLNPAQYGNPRINKTAPDYYYRAAPTVPQGYAPQQQYYAPPPAYAYPPQQQPYVPQYQQAPGSRYYSNPYEIPSAPYGYQAYDTDQYYTPPIAYYGAEPTQNGERPAMYY